MRVFVHVADQRSLSKAGAVLKLSQSAVSRQISRFEEAVGAKLFHRHGHGVALTDAGAHLFRRCKRILADVETLESDVWKQARLDVTGSVTLGVPAPMAARLAGPFLDHFAEKYPGVSLRIVEGFSSFLHEWLLGGTIDLAILYGPRPSTIVDATELLEENLFAIGPPDYRDRDHIDLEELNRHPFIVPHVPHVIRSIVGDTGIQPARYVEVDALSLMVELAHQGKGFSLLPLTAVRQELLSGYVSALPITGLDLSWSVSLCRNDLRPMTPAMQVLYDHVREEVAAMVRSGQWTARR